MSDIWLGTVDDELSVPARRLRRPRELSLFSGAGGGLLATKWLLEFRTICYVEINEYCIQVLRARIGDGLLDDAPIFRDAREFDGKPWRGLVDVLTAGFPCTPFSTAGKQLGGDDERNMWPTTVRIIREVRPAIVFLENVPGIVSSGYIFTVLDDLSEAGYKVFPPLRLAASDVGAPHRRRRIWIMAYAEGRSLGGEGQSHDDSRVGLASSGQGFTGGKANEDVAHSRQR